MEAVIYSYTVINSLELGDRWALSSHGVFPWRRLFREWIVAISGSFSRREGCCCCDCKLPTWNPRLVYVMTHTHGRRNRREGGDNCPVNILPIKKFKGLKNNIRLISV